MPNKEIHSLLLVLARIMYNELYTYLCEENLLY